MPDSTSRDSAYRMSGLVRGQLSAMMFIEFFIWGAWYVTAPNYLGTIGFKAADFGWTYAVGPIAGMISPFFVGMVADRFFPAQRVLGIMHLLGAALMFWATGVMKTAQPNPNLINLIFFGHMLTYFPTLALTNTLAMRNMDDPEKEFPLIRVFGTIGWIAANFTVSWAGWSTTIHMFYLTAASAAALGIFSFFLPHTPPTGDRNVSARQILGLDALVLLKDKSYLIFMISSTLICIPLSFYYQIASRVVEMADFNTVGFVQSMSSALKFGDVIAATMSFGQVSEIFFMIVMPFFFRRLGVKWMLAVGMLAWVLRYTLFAVGAPTEVRWMIFAGIVLHGICYDFFFVTGQIYTDQIAPRAIRAQAQGMLVLFTLGLGMMIGAWVASAVDAKYTPPESTQLGEQVTALGPQINALTDEVAAAPAAERPALETRLKDLQAQRAKLRHDQLAAVKWGPLWGLPAAFAGVILVIFTISFHDNRTRRAPAGS